MNNVETSLKEMEEKLARFSEVLEKFGLDLITKIGQNNLKINMLTDKINELHKATLDIKSLGPQLNNVIESQRTLESELELIKSLISNIRLASPVQSFVNETMERNEVATDKKDAIIKDFEVLREQLDTLDDPKIIQQSLEKIKEDIFEFTGGHRINYEISQVIKRLDNATTLSDEYSEETPTAGIIKKYIQEKIGFWMNKLMVKD